MVLVIVVIGVTMLGSYDKMQNLQNSIGDLSDEVLEENEDKVVETLGENVSSQIEEDDIDEDTVEKPSVETQQSDSQLETPQTDTSESETTQTDTSESTTLIPPETYIVKKGDTLETISREKYGDVSHVEAICELNGLDDGNLIFIGQKLLLP